jgi:circadian clock protein KaiC
MNESMRESKELDRLPSGIAGLDTILHGGFLRGGIYVIAGQPGAGKTILGNQICFNHVAAGGQAVYITLLAETHARMLAHLRSLAFFTPNPIATVLHYFSGYHELERGGLDGLLDLLRQIIRERRATVLVLDGLSAARAAAASVSALKHFIHELHVFGEASGCTTFLLNPSDDRDAYHPEHTIVDGLIELSDHMVGVRAVRELLVPKFRGSSYLRGRHFFEITDAGLVVYPRTEALLALPSASLSTQRQRMGFGISSLDEMLQGGLLSDSTTMVLGPSGSGKTLLGLHFLAAGAQQEQPGLFFGFYETPARLVERANRIGLDLSGFVARGLVEIIWQPPLEQILDALAEQLLTAVRRRHVRRLYIDGFNAFLETSVYPERTNRFFSALSNELRALDVTTIFTYETSELFGPVVKVPTAGVSELVDNIIFMRYVELRSQLYRLISMMETRESGHDTAIREFTITARGIDVAATFESAEAILTGIAHPTRPDAAASASGKRPSRARGR